MYFAFLSTLPARGATSAGCAHPPRYRAISIHAPREGSDPGGRRSPRRWKYFYPRSPRGERRQERAAGGSRQGISIHAPREGSDHRPSLQCSAPPISIHAPREGSDRDAPRLPVRPGRFLSTLPARGATVDDQVLDALDRFLSTLPARGATYPRSGRHAGRKISIHAPREGSDPASSMRLNWTARFLSTLPARGATVGFARWGEFGVFLSTLPARGATSCPTGNARSSPFLSTLPARGATRPSAVSPGAKRFLSTLPARGATKSLPCI